MHAQSKLYKPQTTHTVAVFEAMVSCASQLLTTAARPQQQMLSRSDTFAQHQSAASAGKIDARIFRHQVFGLTAVLFCSMCCCFEFLITSCFSQCFICDNKLIMSGYSAVVY